MSVFVRVTPSGLALDGDDLYRVATSLDSAARSAQSALASTGGMAGNEESAQEFIDGYGEGAVNSLDAAGSYAQALRALDTLLGDTANAYTDAGTIGTLETVATRSPSTTPGSAATFTVPSAKAPGAIGPLGEFQEFVMDALAQIGVVLPDADSGKLGEAASAWSAYSTAITNAANELDGTLTNLAAMDIPQQENIRLSRDRIADKLREIATGATGLADLCSEQQKNVDAMWEEIGWFLAQMAAEIALEAGLGIALTALTGGMAAPAVIAKIATTVMRWVVKIGNLVRRLVTLTRAQAIAAKILLKGLKEGTQSAIATVTVQAAVNHIRGPEHAQSLLAVGLGSFAGGAIGGRVGDGGAHVLRIERRTGISRVALNTAVGSGEGMVDGLTDGLVQSGVTGSPFDPISSAGLGALIGGVARPVGGGTRPNAPSAGSGGGSSTSSPDGVDVPSSSTPDSPLGPTGVDTPSAPSTNTPAAPQGSGGAPSSSAPAAAGGPSPDAPDAPIVDGAGDATTPVDSSGSVDIPAGDTPTGAGADTSTTTNGPDVPDVSAPSGDGGTPSLPDSSPSTPDSSSPSLPDSSPSTPDSSSPSTPDSSTPSTPDAPAPSTPDSSAPSTPDSSTPSTPDATPSTPDSTAPSTPDSSSPSTPDASTPDTTPSTPDSSTPSTPDTTPSTPNSTAPSTPDSNAPSTPDTTPSTPDATPANGSPSTAPVAGASVSPSSPSTSTPDANTSVDSSSFEAAVAADAADASTPDGTTPDGTTPDGTTPDGTTPDGTTPESDATTADDTVNPDALDAGDAATAGAVAAGAAGVVGLHAGASGGKAPSTPASPASPAAPSSPSSNAPTSNAPSSPTPDANTPATPGTPDANTPDAKTPETPEGSNATERTTAEIDAALAEINPNFDPLDPANGYATNCGNTSAILNDFLNGSPTREAPTGTLGVPDMEARTGNPQTRMTPDQIADSLREMGAGSHCVVGIDRSTGDGHWFNAYFDGDTVWSIDAQTGTRSPWPPNEPNATNWDASIRPEDVADPKTPEAEDVGTAASSVDDAGDGSRGNADQSVPRYDQSVVDTLSPESQAIIATAEAEGRTLNRAELNALNTDPAMRDAVDSNANVRRRVKLRVKVIREIIARSERNRDGDFVTRPNDTIVKCRRYPDGTVMRFDINTGRLVTPGSPGMTMPVREAFDFGHRPAHQWRDTRIIATLQEGWSRRDVRDYENVVGHYRIEDFAENRSNRNNDTE